MLFDTLKDCPLGSEEYYEIINDIMFTINEVFNNKNDQRIQDMCNRMPKEYSILKCITGTQLANFINTLIIRGVDDQIITEFCNIIFDEFLDRSWIVNEDAVLANSQSCFESKEDYIDALKNNNPDALLSYEFIDFVIKYPEFANRWNPEIASVAMKREKAMKIEQAMKRAQQFQFEEPKSQDFQDIDFQQQSVESNNLSQSEEGQMQHQKGGVKIGGNVDFHPSVYDKLVQKNPYRLSRPNSPLAQQQVQKGSDQKVEEDVKNSNIQNNFMKHSSEHQKQSRSK